jgi:hypothetical protein
MAALDNHAIDGVDHRNLGGAGKNFLQGAGVVGIEVLEKNKRHAGGVRETGQQGGEGFEASGGGANAYDWENFV